MFSNIYRCLQVSVQHQTANYILRITCYILQTFLLHPFNHLLHPFNLFLHPFILLLHPFNRLLDHFDVFLHPFNRLFHTFNLLLHIFNLLLHPFIFLLHPFNCSVKQNFQSNKNFNFMSLYKATNKVTTQNFNFYRVW